ncbi:MAG: polysaccharide deacetylase family protein [Candidatus Eremiobacteraeota bacterium]|nr:polysaccharide deacetylase family protein [Candidatus Eremiobacteraeota bacterium]MBV8372620.1 polysaccharide deacetylase family protein [Candidatus Eremiobacteraeota bacterium]
MKIVAVLVLIGALAYGGWHAFVHKSNVVPALVTPAMNVHLEFSNDVPARLYRVAQDAPQQDRSGRPRLIALTFDDGPYPVFTPMLLDVLRDARVPATFFLIGRDAQEWPEITRRIETEGNEVGDHTYSHPNLDEESDGDVRNEILQGGDVLWNLTHDSGVRTLFRPPHGRYTERTLQIAQSLGYSTVLWTDDSGDWRTLTTQQIERHLLEHATAPEIVLLHSGKLATIEAMPTVIEHFERAGYRFVTVSELLRRVSSTELNHPLRRSV